MEYPYGWPGGSPCVSASPYSGTRRGKPTAGRACWRLRSALGGCAVSGPLGSMFAKQSKDEAQAYASEDVTGSVARRRAPASAATAGLPSETDLVFARMAIVDVLERGSKDDQRAVGKSEQRRARHRHADRQRLHAGRRHLPRFPGELCARQGAEPGCRAKPAAPQQGDWEVKSLRPWTRS